MMKKIYVRPRAVAVNLQLSSCLMIYSDVVLDILENGTDGEAGAKRYKRLWDDEDLLDNEEDEENEYV